MKIRFHIGGTFAAAALVAVPAAAKQETRVASVNLAGLDLTSAADRDLLQARMRKTAKAICAYSADDRPVDMARDHRNCIRKALGDADKQVAEAISRAFVMSQSAQFVAER